MIFKYTKLLEQGGGEQIPYGKKFYLAFKQVWFEKFIYIYDHSHVMEDNN
jgi:hypothetical protein